ncbi:MAG: imidazolonepropionase [Hyphomicrobiales bacterium]|nr:imidazolonepropionase [Hyphomicrobiales bacterium]
MDPTLAAAYGLLTDAAIVIENGFISWVGQHADLPKKFNSLMVKDFADRLITPAFIDCHTHIVAGGNRAEEFEMRLTGVSYADIAKAGGGIISTVKATRSATEDQLLTSALQRVDALLAEGVSLIEVKSGYGLDVECELKMLRVARRIGNSRNIRVVTSFLGAHAIPPEFSGRSDEYLNQVCIPTLKRAHAEGLVDAVDGFCETIAFSPAQIAKLFDVAKQLGLPVKLHAEQLTNLGGSALAASYAALSVDHIEYLDEAGVKAIANSGTVATLLPSAFYTLKETQVPPIDLLRKHNVPMAIATDCNPGSSPNSSLLLTMNMACTLFNLTPEESLAGVTGNAALALGLQDTGIIKPGLRADLAIWNVNQPAELCYRLGINNLAQRILGGHYA